MCVPGLPEWEVLGCVVHEYAASTHESSIEGVTQRAECLGTREAGLGTRHLIISKHLLKVQYL